MKKLEAEITGFAIKDLIFGLSIGNIKLRKTQSIRKPIESFIVIVFDLFCFWFLESATKQGMYVHNHRPTN